MFKRLREWSQFRRVREWYRKYERLLMPAALLFGFVGDVIAVSTIDLEVTQFILLGHLVVVGGGILIVNLPPDKMQGKFFRYVRLFAPLAMQYSFGALFSVFLVLYAYSGSLVASWPFILALVLLFVGSEVFKKQYERLLVQMSVYTFAVFSYMILVVPYVLREIGTLVFILSGILTALTLYSYLALLARTSPHARLEERQVTVSAAVVFIAINFLYFFNLIPPFPLSLREAGVYYGVERVSEGYRVLDDNDVWYERLLPFDIVRVASENETLYIYSAVFAPTELSAEVVHEWHYRDPDRGWRRISRVSFPIMGGRSGGYRGYSYHSHVPAGWYRVSIETGQGKVIGNEWFRVVETDEAIEKEFEVRE